MTAPIRLKVKIEFDKDGSLRQMLKDFPMNIQKRMLKTGLRHAGKVISKEVHKRMPYQDPMTNDNKFHIKDYSKHFKVTGYSKSNTATLLVGPESSKRRGQLMHLIEDGTVERHVTDKTEYKTIGRKLVKVGKGASKRRIWRDIKRKDRIVQGFRGRSTKYAFGTTYRGKMWGKKKNPRPLQSAFEATQTQQMDAIDKAIVDSVNRQIKRQAKANDSSGG